MAASKKSAEKTTKIAIDRMDIVQTEFTIVGITPLIVHAWSEKAKRMMMGDMIKTKKKEPRRPVADFIESMYWLTEKPDISLPEDELLEAFNKAIKNGAKFGFPVDGIKKSICFGAYRSGLDVTKVGLAGTFFLKGATSVSTFDMAEIISDSPIMREDMVRLNKNVADLRWRGEFRNWQIKLVLEYNKNGAYSLDQLLQCVDYGGYATGIGEWRPEKNGQFGMYKLLV